MNQERITASPDSEAVSAAPSPSLVELAEDLRARMWELDAIAWSVAEIWSMADEANASSDRKDYDTQCCRLIALTNLTPQITRKVIGTLDEIELHARRMGETR